MKKPIRGSLIIYAGNERRHKLKQAALDGNTNVNQIIIKLIDKYLKQEDKENVMHMPKLHS